MKHLKILSVLLFSLSFLSSCDKEEQEPDSVVGLWTVQGTEYDATVNGVDILTLYTYSGGSTEQAAIFEATLKSTVDSFILNANIKFNADSSFAVAKNEQFTQSGIWKLNSDASVLTLEFADGNEVLLDVVSLSSSEMVLTGFYPVPVSTLPITAPPEFANEIVMVNFELSLTK